jgi:hypothetical protein
MNSVCRHCENWIDGIAYRVLSQDNGSILLNMIVCDRCAMVARRLGLAVVKIAAPVECED